MTEVVEPTFEDIVLLYRRAPPKPTKKDSERASRSFERLLSQIEKVRPLGVPSRAAVWVYMGGSVFGVVCGAACAVRRRRRRSSPLRAAQLAARSPDSLKAFLGSSLSALGCSSAQIDGKSDEKNDWVVLKSYAHVPVSDIELCFPDTTVELPLFEIVMTIVLCLVAMLSLLPTLLSGAMTSAMLPLVLVVLGRVVTKVTALLNLQTTLGFKKSLALYNKSRDSQVRACVRVCVYVLTLCTPARSALDDFMLAGSFGAVR